MILCFIDKLYEFKPRYKKHIKKYVRKVAINKISGTDMETITKFMGASSSFQKKYADVIEKAEDKKITSNKSTDDEDLTYFNAF